MTLVIMIIYCQIHGKKVFFRKYLFKMDNFGFYLSIYGLFLITALYFWPKINSTNPKTQKSVKKWLKKSCWTKTKNLDQCALVQNI